MITTFADPFDALFNLQRAVLSENSIRPALAC
jgi:hypothetical protein